LISSWQSFGFPSLEGCTAITEASTPPNSLGYISIFWKPEAAGSFIRWLQLGGLWTSLGQTGWFFAPSFGVTGTHLMLILLGLTFLYAIHDAKVNTLVEMWIGGADESAAFELVDCSMNTNLTSQILVSSGYVRQVINALGAPVTGMGPEMSDFCCLEPSTTAITAIDVMILSLMGPY
jgi:hypothetical protein